MQLAIYGEDDEGSETVMAGAGGAGASVVAGRRSAGRGSMYRLLGPSTAPELTVDDVRAFFEACRPRRTLLGLRLPSSLMRVVVTRVT
jgi:hypothetical protein